MEKRGLILRRRDTKDRRFVTTRITPEGLEILAALDTPVAKLHRLQFGRLSEAEVTQLTAVLEKLQGSVE
jgi:DNA-binding MarR family transcriptional regulator